VLIGKWKVEGVGFDPARSVAVLCDFVLRLRAGALQHRMREVRAPRICALSSLLLAQGEGHVSGAAAEIEHAGVWLSENVREKSAPCDATTVDLCKRQNVLSRS